MVQSQQTVLFVLTSTKTMGAAGKPTGAWLEEFTVPYYAIRDAGLLADIVTTAGGAVPFDPRSTEEGSAEVPENRCFRSDPELQSAVQRTSSVEQRRFADYAAIFLPGGHGTMWDFPSSAALARGVSDIFAAGKPVAAVCHGPAGLVGAIAPDGRPLVAGRWVSAFNTDEEVALGLKKAVPFLLDERLASLGARIVKGGKFCNDCRRRWQADHRAKPEIRTCNRSSADRRFAFGVATESLGASSFGIAVLASGA